MLDLIDMPLHWGQMLAGVLLYLIAVLLFGAADYFKTKEGE